MDLNHLHINSPVIDESVAFYKDFLGFSRAEKLDSGSYFLFNDDGFMLAIGQLKEKTPLPEWFHFGFRLNSVDEVKALYKRLQDSKITISEGLQTYDDFTFFRCLEPAGYEIEVYWEPTK